MDTPSHLKFLFALSVIFAAQLSIHLVSAGVMINFFKDTNFKGRRQVGTLNVPNECNNLLERFDNQISSLRWTPTVTVKYTHDDWLVFFDNPNCDGGERFHVFANESDYFSDLADYYFDNKISSYQYLVVRL